MQSTLSKTKINYNPNIDLESVELEKQHWLKKMKRILDKRVNKDKNQRDFIIKEVMKLDKCCLVDDYFINTQYCGNYKSNNEFLKSFEVDKKDFIKNGLSLYSNDWGINPFMINQWFKECKNELLKRL